jgi:hypothetical protein
MSFRYAAASVLLAVVIAACSITQNSNAEMVSPSTTGSLATWSFGDPTLKVQSAGSTQRFDLAPVEGVEWSPDGRTLAVLLAAGNPGEELELVSGFGG